MRRSIYTVAALCLFATPTFAGGPTVFAPEPPVVVAQPVPVTDWSGFYAGLGYGKSSGDIDFVPAPPQALDDGKAASIFIGRQWQRGSLVYGGELSYTALKDNFVTGFTCCELDRAIDLKGRLGFAANRLLVYGVLGYSRSSYDEGAGNWDPDGLGYGAGVDFLVVPRVALGLEYMARDLTGDNPDGSGQEVDIDLDTLSLRASLRF